MAEGAAEERPSAEGILAPVNFLAYVGASVRLYRFSARRVALAFALLGASVAVTTGAAAAVASSAESTRLLLIIIYVQLLALPFVGSLMVARASRVMARALAGEEVAVRQAGAELRALRSHLLAGGMIAAFLTLILLQTFGLLGGLVASHLFVGPPIVVHAIALERKSFQDAWARTKEIWKGQALRVFLYLLCAALGLVMLEVLLSGLILSALVAAVGGTTASLLNAPVAGAISGLGISFMAAFGLVAYFDLRHRKEEFEVMDLREDAADDSGQSA